MLIVDLIYALKIKKSMNFNSYSMFDFKKEYFFSLTTYNLNA